MSAGQRFVSFVSPRAGASVSACLSVYLSPFLPVFFEPQSCASIHPPMHAYACAYVIPAFPPPPPGPSGGAFLTRRHGVQCMLYRPSEVVGWLVGRRQSVVLLGIVQLSVSIDHLSSVVIIVWPSFCGTVLCPPATPRTVRRPGMGCIYRCVWWGWRYFCEGSSRREAFWGICHLLSCHAGDL